MSGSFSCAVYARYSSTRQRATSIEDQIRVCRRFAQERSWEILENHIYTDQAVTGSFIAPREGLKQMLAIATSGSAPFQRILVDDTSRTARNTREALEVFALLTYYGIHVSYVAQGIDTAQDSAEDLITINGLADSRFLRVIAKETHRGMEGRFLKGYSAGGRRYGYRTEPVHNGRVDIYGNPEVEGYKFNIKPDEAETVVQVFRMYADDKISAARIVKTLNHEFKNTGTPVPPNGESWTLNTILGGRSSLRGILNNEMYIGRYHWNKTTIRKSPHGAKKLFYKDKSHWRLALHPELQIVPDDLWRKAQERRKKARAFCGGKYTNGKALYSGNLLTGLLRCGHCGGNIVVVYGRENGKYGCSNNWHKGDAICPNDHRVPRRELDRQIVELLSCAIAPRDALSEVTVRVNWILEKRREDDSATWRLSASEKELRRAQRELDNVKNAIRFGELTTRVEILRKDRDVAIMRISEKEVKPYFKYFLNTLKLNPRVGKALLMECLPEIRCQSGADGWSFEPAGDALKARLAS
ncbi:MAG: recombinase family protein [Nitrospinae bacterium]|nr:recombinase family protein [Nitrospinota bacterium]